MGEFDFRKAWWEKVWELRNARKKNDRLRSRIKVLAHDLKKVTEELNQLRYWEKKVFDGSIAMLGMRYKHLKSQLAASLQRELEWTARAEKAENELKGLTPKVCQDLEEAYAVIARKTLELEKITRLYNENAETLKEINKIFLSGKR